jgi:hypothetical protein
MTRPPALRSVGCRTFRALCGTLDRRGLPGSYLRLGMERPRRVLSHPGVPERVDVSDPCRKLSAASNGARYVRRVLKVGPEWLPHISSICTDGHPDPERP